MQVTSQIAVVLLEVCRAWTNKTRESASYEECDARLERLQDEHDTSRRARVLRVVDRSKSSFYILAFGAVDVFIILNVLGLHVNLV